MSPRIGQADPEMSAEPFMLFSARPFDSQVVRNLPVIHANLTGHIHGYLVGFYLGRPVHVVVPPVPEFLALVPLTDVGQFVEDVKVEDAGFPSLEVAQPEVDPTSFVVNVGVGVLGNQVDLRFSQNLLSQAVIEQADEVRVLVQAWENGGQSFGAGAKLPVYPGVFGPTLSLRLIQTPSHVWPEAFS